MSSGFDVPPAVEIDLGQPAVSEREILAMLDEWNDSWPKQDAEHASEAFRHRVNAWMDEHRNVDCGEGWQPLTCLALVRHAPHVRLPDETVESTSKAGRSGAKTPMIVLTRETAKGPETQLRLFYNANTFGANYFPVSAHEAITKILERILGDQPPTRHVMGQQGWFSQLVEKHFWDLGRPALYDRWSGEDRVVYADNWSGPN